MVRIGSTLWKGPFASAFVASSRKCWRPNWKRPRSAADMLGAALRTGIVSGHRERQLIGTFGPVTASVPRARLVGTDGRTSEWRNRTISARKRLTRRAEALIAATYLAGTKRGGYAGRWPRCSAAAIGQDVVSRAWAQGPNRLGGSVAAARSGAGRCRAPRPRRDGGVEFASTARDRAVAC